MAYSEKVIDHYQNPKNVGTLDKSKSNVGTGLVGAPECFVGDTLIAIPEYPGYISIEQIYKNNSQIYVWSYNIISKKFEIKRAICIKTGRKSVVELKMDDLSIIKVTPSHKFLTIDHEYVECQNLKDKSIKSFNKIVNSNGYWEVNKKPEHIEYFRYYYNDNYKHVFKFNIDHKNSNKLDNSILNLEKLSLKDHIKKTDIIKLQLETESFVNSFNNSELLKQLSENYCRFEIGNKLGITTDKVRILQKAFGISNNEKYKMPSRKEQYEIHSKRMKKNNPYFKFTPEEKFRFASKPGYSNPKWINVENDELIKIGNKLYINNKLTNSEWCKYAKSEKLPQNLSARFGSFNNFKQLCINYNHKILDIKNLNEENVYTLMVEENNNYVVLTSIELNRQSGIVVKNCGDVMRLQIEVDDIGVITDAKFKTFGCGSAIASSSLATEWLKGKTIEDAVNIDNMSIVEELNLPPVKIHCSVLAEDAIKAAIDDYLKKNNLPGIV